MKEMPTGKLFEQVDEKVWWLFRYDLGYCKHAVVILVSWKIVHFCGFLAQMW